MSRRPPADHARMRLEWERGLHLSLKELAQHFGIGHDHARRLASQQGWRNPTRQARDAVAEALAQLFREDTAWAAGTLRLNAALRKKLLTSTLDAILEDEKRLAAARLLLGHLDNELQLSTTLDGPERAALTARRDAAAEMVRAGSAFKPKTIEDVVALAKAASLIGTSDIDTLNLAAKLEQQAERPAGSIQVGVGVQLPGASGAAPGPIVAVSVQQWIERKRDALPPPEPPQPPSR